MCCDIVLFAIIVYLVMYLQDAFLGKVKEYIQKYAKR